MQYGDLASIISLMLAVLFWILSSRQAEETKKTLIDIKSSIIDWQSKLNDASINIISSRPEIIAKETSMLESKSISDFSSQLSSLIEKLSLAQPGDKYYAEYQEKVLSQLLDHHRNLILGKQKLLNDAIMFQHGIQNGRSKNEEQNE